MFHNQFVPEARQLRSKGRQLSQLHQIYKTMGLGVAGLSGLALLSSGGALLPLIAGALAYGGAVVSERSRTGKTLPLPWVSADLGTIAAKTLDSELPAGTLQPIAHHYLSPEDKALYFLVNFQGDKLTALKGQMDDDVFDLVVSNLVDHLVTAHQPALNHPELLGRALNTNFLGEAISALPEDLRQMLPSVQPKHQQPVIQNQQSSAPKPTAIGSQTRINAIPASASSAPELFPAPNFEDLLELDFEDGESDPWEPTYAEQSQPMVHVYEPITPKTTLDILVDKPFTSRAIFGAQRTGKSYLAAVASRRLAQKGVKTYHLNLASYGNEDHEYWSHAAQSVRCDLSMVNAEKAADYIGRALAMVHHFFNSDGEPAILVVDEWAYIGSSSNAYCAHLSSLMALLADKISALASAGVKRRKAIWSIAPEFVAGNLVQDAKSIKKLELCLVSIAPGKSVLWEGQPVTFNFELYSQLKNNFTLDMPRISASIAGCDRIAFVGGHWHPVGVDQDSLKLVGV